MPITKRVENVVARITTAHSGMIGFSRSEIPIEKTAMGPTKRKMTTMAPKTPAKRRSDKRSTFFRMFCIFWISPVLLSYKRPGSECFEALLIDQYASLAQDKCNTY